MLLSFYSNITLAVADQDAVLTWMRARGARALLSSGVRGAIVVFHEDLSAQEELARQLSAHFRCAALLVMGYGQGVLLYQLYQSGEQTDSYVSSPHDELEAGEDPMPSGNVEVLCAAFNIERSEMRVQTILAKEGKPGQPYEYAVNRHGELARALGLPQFAAGASYHSIEVGELPNGDGFDLERLASSP
jgi:hypothetical protein